MRQIPLPELKGYYLTKEGEIWSERLNRFLVMDNQLNPNRYKGVKMNRKRYEVHRLMGYTYLGLEPDAGRMMQIDHIDGDRHNNNLSNLRIVSAKEHRKLSEEQKIKRGELITIQHEVTGQILTGTTVELAAHPAVESSRHALYNLVRGLNKRTRAGWKLIKE